MSRARALEVLGNSRQRADTVRRELDDLLEAIGPLDDLEPAQAAAYMGPIRNVLVEIRQLELDGDEIRDYVGTLVDALSREVIQ